MKVLLLLTFLVAATQAISFFDLAIEEWEVFKLEHKKNYESDTEDKYRMKIFMDNKHKIAKHNVKFQAGTVTFELGVNKYSDMLHHEFIHTLNGFNRTARLGKLKQGEEGSQAKLQGASFIEPANVDLPAYVNWVEKGAVTPVKDQGQCGSCWSFSSTGALEGQNFRKSGVLVSLSEQNLIDCSADEGNQGCNGGLMDQAFKYVKLNHGIDTEISYPYTAEVGNCSYKARNKGASDVGFVDIPQGSEKKLKSAVATVGPVSIAIDASQPTFQLYKSGVYVEEQCSSDQLDHGVLVVGYGTDKESGLDYWLVKNSWGPTWGEDGYIKMARNHQNQCGVASSASYPLV